MTTLKGDGGLDDQATQDNAQDSTPIFQRIKDYLLAEIAAGTWKEGDVIRPSRRWSSSSASRA
jgi:DNA-binding transcriptional regulator YhcF (GntR family)